MIVDTGPLVALLNRRDQNRTWCVPIFAALTGPMLTTEAVLTETFFLCADIAARKQLAALIATGDLVIHATEEADKVCEYAIHYGGDFADASLVALSERYPASRIFTVDFRDFAVYRRFRDQPIPLIERS